MRFARARPRFDGRTFRIPQPHLTFTRRASMEPHRRVLLESFFDALGDAPLFDEEMHDGPCKASCSAEQIVRTLHRQNEGVREQRFLALGSRMPENSIQRH